MNTTPYLSKLVSLLRRVPVTSSIAVAAIIVAVFPSLANLLQYDRAAIEGGEFWRLATCYLTHWNADHLTWDLLMFLVLGGACEIRNPLRMRTSLLAGIVAVSALVYLAFPDITTYRGLSGLDTAMFTLLATGLLCEAWRERNTLQTLATGGLLLALSAKTVYEAVTGQTLFVDQQAADFVPLVYDHIAGAAVGVAASFLKPSTLERLSNLHTPNRKPLAVAATPLRTAKTARYRKK
ncbi:MAG: rhombosortase [Planctomycetes bacterium]|nr:rhombosortase [Planctomycetota bacterium]